MTAAIKIERLVVQFAARLARHPVDCRDYPAEKERLVTAQELALLSR
ncbi:MAG: hypothetical protein WCE30_23955 [Mycobacterium sp.]